MHKILVQLIWYLFHRLSNREEDNNETCQFEGESKCLFMVCKIWSLYPKSSYYLTTLGPNGDTNQTQHCAALDQVSLP